MAKKIARSNTAPKKATNPPTAKPKSPAQLAVQAAGKITGDLICSLQNERKAFLRIGQLLAEVRDRKHYATLHHGRRSVGRVPQLLRYLEDEAQQCGIFRS
jgi:hypothetical protein